MSHEDSLWLSCHVCGEVVAKEQVEHDQVLPAWKVIRWHERMIAHVRKEHLRKRKQKRTGKAKETVT